MDKGIEKIEAREILDSRGTPTIEVSVHAFGSVGAFSVPSGKSKGSHEVVSLSTQDAIASVTHLNDELKGFPLGDQSALDSKLMALDGTSDKSKLGGNALLGVSVAYAKVSAKLSGKEIYEYLQEISNLPSSGKVPRLYVNLINGGEHSESPLAFQEYHMVPETDSIRESLEIASRIQEELKTLVEQEFGNIILGDEGGFVLNTSDVKKPLELIAKAIEKAGSSLKVRLSLDVAASSFYKNGKYLVGEVEYDRDKLIDLYQGLISKYGIFSIEDPLEEEDFEGFREFREKTKISAVGDDLTVTNPERIKKAIENKSIDAVIIKPNQIGTLTETLEAIRVARGNGVDCIVSHRSGETEDTFIADLAWAFGCLGLKAGAPSQEVRKVKYERLCQIQEHK